MAATPGGAPGVNAHTLGRVRPTCDGDLHLTILEPGAPPARTVTPVAAGSRVRLVWEGAGGGAVCEWEAVLVARDGDGCEAFSEPLRGRASRP